MRYKLGTLAMLWFGSVAAFAQESGRFAAPTQVVAPQEIGAGSGFLQIFGSLLLVIATIVVIGWIAGRLRALPRRSSAVFRVVDEVAVGTKERVVMVEVDGARLVLGVAEGRVSLLHRSDVPAGDTQLDDESRLLASNAAAPRFIDILKKGLGK